MWQFLHTACTMMSADAVRMNGWIRKSLDVDVLAGSRDCNVANSSVNRRTSNYDVFAADLAHPMLTTASANS
jgi:hypothetical protein